MRLVVGVGAGVGGGWFNGRGGGMRDMQGMALRKGKKGTGKKKGKRPSA